VGYLVSAIVVMLFAALFVLQNMEPVYVKFLFWNMQMSLALALLVAFSLGSLVALLIHYAGHMKNKFSKQTKEN
jgi:uncharacterized integral membrane protein